MNTSAMFSSKTDMWETPRDLFDRLNSIHHFTLDVCALPENAKCKDFYTPKENGLLQKWGGCCWCNPPYGREIGKWVKKAYEEDCKVVMLLPARTDTKWFHDYCLKGEVEFLRGRLKFGKAQNSAPFPSMIVIFDKKKKAEKDADSN